MIKNNLVKGMLFICLAMCLLTSCTKKQDTAQEDREENLVYSAEYYKVLEYAEDIIYAFDCDNNELIINCRTSDDYKSGKKLMSVKAGDKVNELAGGADFSGYSSFVCHGGYCYAAKESGSSVELVKLDRDFNELASIVTDIKFQIYDEACYDGIKSDSEGRLYIMSSSLLQVYDSELNELCRIDVNGNFRGIVTCGDRAYTIERDGLNSVLSEINITAQTLERVTGSLPGDFMAACGADGKIYMTCTGVMYEYDIASDSLSNALNLIDYGIYGISVRNMYIDNEGSFIMTIEERYMTPDDFSMGIEVIKKVPEDTLPPKKEVTIATYGSDSAFVFNYNQIVRFVRSNPDYIIHFDNYCDDYADSVSFDEFSKMLISGIDADIFLLYDTDMIKNMADKGLLYNLDNFISSDEELNNALIPNVHEKMKYNGGLYGITDYFKISTLTGRKSVVGERAEWNVQKITELLENDENLTLFASGDAGSTLSTLIYGGVCMDEDFIKNEGFDSDSFVELLELCRLCGSRNKNSDKIVLDEKAILDGNAMVVNDSNSFYEVRNYYALYGDDEFVRAGYPDDAGGRTVMKLGDMLCISNSSENKDAAWEVVRSFLSSDYYENVHNPQSDMYPVVQKEFEKQINNELENQNTQTISILSLDDNLNVIDEQYIDAPMISSEQAGIIMDEINTASISKYDIDGTIISIISEEAQYFFEGQKTAGEVGKIIQDRVQLYLDEKD